MISVIKQWTKKCIHKIFRDELEASAEMTAHIISTAELHKKTFLPYKNYCMGEKDIVVCGAGPTLNQYNPISDAYHIAVNRAFLYEKVDFDFIFAQDFDGIKMVQEELVSYRMGECVKFLGTQTELKRKIPESLILKCNAHRFDTDGYIYQNGMKGNLVVDIESRPLCNMINVGQSVMQLALYMNPKHIYIVGCDMSGNHFANGNQTDEEVAAQEKELDLFWKKEQKALLERWREIKNFAELYYPDTEIISVNPVGLKGLFRDIFQESVQ